ncbi:MAG: EF-P lysine aminoacylase GenX [Candidatus Magasanikbacteria bacterium]|nr:EF-P lysine aminoacylase GenX [Candidatus Magasanikbacteria bacterium]
MSNWKELKDNPRLNQIYRDRVAIIRAVREFFWSKDFLETDTPMAVKYAGQEPFLNPVPLTIHDPNGKSENFHLVTSPEFSLKKLLAVGFEKIFSITKCFRDYESFGGTHNTEFTMIEWYRAPGTLTQIMDDTEALFKAVGKKLGHTSVEYNNVTVEITETWERKTMKQLWQEYVGVNLDEYLEIVPLKQLVLGKKLAVDTSGEYEDLFFKIFLNFIEPRLGFEKPLFVYDYPKRLSSLSRACAHDARYAERFELYIAGLEIANAFGELTDATEQQARLEADQALRAKLGRPTWPVDPSFIAALRSGMPEAGGIALGVDRMVLLFTGAKDINEVIFQSISDQLA